MPAIICIVMVIFVYAEFFWDRSSDEGKDFIRGIFGMRGKGRGPK